MKKALFFDRDGTLIRDVPYLSNPEQVSLFPDTKAVLSSAREAGFLLFLFTNQSGIGRGYYTVKEVNAIHDRLLSDLNLGKDLFTGIKVAPEVPDQPINYRKPSPKYLLEMIDAHQLNPSHTWMIGDRTSDIKAGLNAGVRVAGLKTSQLYDEEMSLLLKQNGSHAYPNLGSVWDFISKQ